MSCHDIFTEGAPVKALVRWATGKRLTDRLPKLSLTTPIYDQIAHFLLHIVRIAVFF